jgi:hypothetical protein
LSGYLDIANTKILFILVIIVILFVLGQAFVFLAKAWREGIKIGMDKGKMVNAIKSSAVFSIVPSLPIILSLIAMVPVLGLPFPWLRLSVIGSAPYELMAADIGAKSMGIKGLGAAGYTDKVFANSLWIMTVGILWGLMIVIFFLKRFQKGMNKIKKKDSKWLEIMISALYFGMLCTFIGQPVVEGGVALLTLISSAAIMAILGILIKKFKMNWLTNFALSISMVGAMVLAIIFSRV